MTIHLDLWAKRGAGLDVYHPLACHLLDVAAVSEALWDLALSPRLRAWFAEGLGLSQDGARHWLAWACASHDIGKASPTFQTKERFADPTPHGIVSASVLLPKLREMGLSASAALDLALLIGGHHGVVPKARDLTIPVRHVSDASRDWETTRHAVLTDVTEALGLTPIPLASLSAAHGLWLAGLIAVADWLGSNERFFPFTPDVADLTAYAAQAREQAKTALRALGWLARPTVRELEPFADLFPDHEPNPLQLTVEAVARQIGAPTITIIEAPMGTGKTEAALYLAEHGSRFGLTGHTLLLPTQATSNQMFGRQAAALDFWYDEPVAASLAHGRAILATQLAEIRDRDPDGVAVIAPGWFAGRRQGLLAPFGVATIDQMLLGVLPSRHHAVRLVGLAGTTAIIDEAHAYDTYMSALMERAVEWLAALGSSVVVLSATLPAAARKALLNAYARGRSGTTVDVDAEQPPYPRITWLAGDEVQSVAVPVIEGRESIRLSLIRESAVVDTVTQRLARGGCTAVICNTVAAAQEMYVALRHAFATDQIGLLHARFPAEVRAARETRYLSMLGPRGERPDRFVLVATQVIEQSLDIDFDLILTALAPTDLVLQRVGRLHRHPWRKRSPGLEHPELLLIQPAEINGLPDFGVDASVYDDYVLLRSWELLRHRRLIAVPGEIEALVEATYAEDDGLPDEPQTRERWQTSREKMVADRETERRLAEVRWVSAPDAGPASQVARAPEVEDDDSQPATRLTLPTIEVVCVEAGPSENTYRDPRNDEVIYGYGHRPDRDLVHALLGRSLRVQGTSALVLRRSLPAPSGWSRVGLLRSLSLLPLVNGEASFGGLHLRLDEELGLVSTWGA